MSESPAGGLDLKELEALTRAYDSTVVGLPESVVVISRARVLALIEEIRALRMALRPFAIAAAEYQEESAGCVITDGLQIDGESEIAHPILWGDLRRAADVLGSL